MRIWDSLISDTRATSPLLAEECILVPSIWVRNSGPRRCLYSEAVQPDLSWNSRMARMQRSPQRSKPVERATRNTNQVARPRPRSRQPDPSAGGYEEAPPGDDVADFVLIVRMLDVELREAWHSVRGYPH